MKKLNLHIRNCFRLILTAVFLFCGSFAMDAKPEKSVKSLKQDTSSIKLNQPSQQGQSKYAEDDYYKYKSEKAAENTEPDVFDRLWNNFWEKIWESFQAKKDGSFNPWNILWILIFVTLLILVILKLTNSGVNTIFSGKRKVEEKIDATLADVDIHSIDYEQQIKLAISKGDFRLAVRLWFLRTLKSFSDKELVNWKIDKTNSDYYYELSGTKFQQEFGDVSKVYDYIWYGEFPVDENSYKNAEDKFRGLNNKLE